MTQQPIDTDPIMGMIARAAMQSILEAHLRAVEHILDAVGEHLRPADRAALLDHFAATGRLSETLNAEAVEGL